MSARNLTHRHQAKDLYVSTWFKKARRYIECKSCPWYILSAEYGLVTPEQPLAPYEKTLNTTPLNERREWACRVIAQMNEMLPQARRVVVFLAGQRYREFLADHLKSRGIVVEVPMEGLRIGQQLSWLGRHA